MSSFLFFSGDDKDLEHVVAMILNLFCRCLLIFFQEMRKDLQHFVPMILNLFHDSHVRVRWAAIHAIGLLSTDLSPDLQQQQYQQVLPALVGAMNDFQNPRVQVSGIGQCIELEP
jgi:hypothetical protein